MWSDRMYYYPVQETFRYHFPYSRSPSPKTTGSQNNGRGSVNRGYPFFDRSYSRLHPMAKTARKNEVAELDHRVVPDLVLASAPFGNHKTPNIQMRLVGGKYVPAYIGEQPTVNVQPLHPITLPPQQIDPRSSLDVSYYKDAHDYFSYQDESGDMYDEFDPTTLVNKRPDSKDVARLQYKTLPPIQQNRTRNDMSTVFEAEPWTHNRQPSLARETEYKTHYNPELDEQDFHYHPNSRPDTTALYVDEEEKRDLLKTLPRNVILPAEPIKLSRDQEVTACKLINKDLGNFESQRLRDVYVDCSQHDKHLDGFCAPSALETSLRRHGAYLSQSDTFRIIEAQFVDPRRLDKVNYEKVLSFIGSAIEMYKKGQLGAKTIGLEHEDTDFRDQSLTLGPDRPRYYMQNGEHLHTGSIYKDREVAKLLRMVEQELSKSTYQMDWTKWQNLFHEKDRDHRGTLSGSQIKDVCYDCHLPLSDSIINSILCLCEDNNRDGQYKWTSFFDFLDKIRPSNTGLPIPVSKRPLEYAKHYPQPVANWPRSDNDAAERKEAASPRRDPSPRRGDYYKQDSKHHHHQQQQQQQQQYDDRVKSPPRDKPPTAERRERQVKTETIDRHKYSPERQSCHRSPDGPHHKSHDHHGSPTPSPNRQYVPLEQYELERRIDEFRQNKQYPSGGYKPSWQENGIQGEPKHLAQTTDRGRKPRQASPKWAQTREHDHHTDRQYNTKEPRYITQDPYDRAMQAWVEQHRNPSPYGIQRRTIYNRPYSYAEPQRKNAPRRLLRRPRPSSYIDTLRGVYQETRLQPVQDRTRTPVQRSRSLSPVRFVSPIPGQQRYPHTHREFPSTHREKQYPYGYRQDQFNQQMYSNRYINDNSIQQNRPYYEPKAPYASDKEETYRSTNNYRQLQPNQGSYPQEQLPRFAHTGSNTYNNPTARENNGYQNNWDARYESQQQYRSPPPPPHRQQYQGGDSYRRQDDRGGYQNVRDDKIRQLSNELGSLEAKYKITKDSMKNTDQPWLQRYLKLAEALYNIDTHNSGCLPRTNVMEIVRQYNDAFNLNLDMSRANMLAISPENLDRSGNVILRPYLAALCGDSFTDKP